MQNEAQKEQELRSAIEEAERATQDYKPKLEALGAQEKEKARELAQCKEGEVSHAAWWRRVGRVFTALRALLRAADIARVKKRNARTLNEMTRGTLFFRRLGLDFVYIDEETLQFIFTQVDPVDPERQFSIDISVAQNNYCVKQCEPALEGLDDYVHDINRTNDLALFLKRVRRGFRSYAQQQQQ